MPNWHSSFCVTVMLSVRDLKTFSMEGHTADILKTRGPKLTQIW